MALSPWGPYRPDAAETNTSVSPNITNATAFKDPEAGLSYGPLKGLSVPATADALPEAPRGGVSVVDRAGVYSSFIGTGSELYKLAVDFGLVSIGSGYAVPSGDNWSMAPFGNLLLATNRFDGVQEYDVEAGGTATPLAGAPVARILFPCFDCMFYGDCDGDNRLLINSAINDHANISSGGAGYQVMPDGEEIVGGRELTRGFGVLFQRNAVRSLNRVGDGRIYTMDVLGAGVGAVNPDCIASINGAAFFIDTDGPQMVTQEGIRAIGEGKVARTFIESLAANGLTNVQAAIDPKYARVRWRYKRFDVDSDTVFQHALDYYWRLDEFVAVEDESSYILTLGTPGYDMDSIDALYPSMDDPTMPDMDSRFWFGGEPTLGGLNADFQFGTYEGMNLAAILESGTITLANSLMLRSLKPVTDSPNSTIAIAARDALNATRAYSADEYGIQRSGVVRIRARGKNLSARQTVPAAEIWTFARGIDDIVGQAGGMR
jgi:hypothetical protein